MTTTVTTHRYPVGQRVTADEGAHRIHGTVALLAGAGQDGRPFCGEHDFLGVACVGPFYSVVVDDDGGMNRLHLSCYAEHELQPSDVPAPPRPTIHVLVAGRGDRADDFAHTLAGELVRPSSLCDRDREDPTSPCGCARAFTGMISGKATSVAVVAEAALSHTEYAALLRGPGEADSDLGATVVGLLATAAQRAVGTTFRRPPQATMTV